MKYMSYLKSFRNSLRRNVLYTFVNVSGFAISLAFVIYLGLYVQSEYSVDSFHTNKDRIFRLEYQDGTLLAYPVADYLKSRYPEIESVTRILWRDIILKDVQGNYFDGKAIVTDSSFFSIFSFPFVEGNPQSAMQAQNEIVLSESFARKVLGNQAALGKTITLYGKQYIISGVVRDFEQTHFNRADIFLPYSFIVSEWGEQIVSKDVSAWNTYILAVKGADLAAKLLDMEQYLKTGMDYPDSRKGIVTGLKITPLQQIYFSRSTNDPTYQRANDVTFLVILTVVALLILVFAIINYINLSVAQLGDRAQQIAVRRLLGESRRGVFIAHIVESVVLCTISLLISLLIVAILTPWLQQVLNTNVSLASSLTWGNMAILIVGVGILGTISGAIPAAVVTGFKPIEIVRGTFRRKTKSFYSRALIIFQYGITIILIGCTITVVAQLHFMKNGDLGFDKEQLIVCSNLCKASEQEGFRNQLMAIPGVKQVSFVRGFPMAKDLETMDVETSDQTHILLDSYAGDTAFISILGLDILHRTGVEHPQAYWFNESAWRRLGLSENAIEYRTGDGKVLRIRGKIRNFHSRDFTHSIDGCIIQPLGNYEAWEILIKVAGGDPFATMDRIRRLYNERAEGNLFDGSFMDQYVAGLYEKQKSISQMVSILAFVAIVISSLGMLAMATYFTRQRMQEVAVRKTFGAQNGEVLRMLMMSFMKLVAGAFVIAVPVIWQTMQNWLSQYAYRVGLSWWIFAGAGLLAFLIAGAMVLGQSLRTAHTNPVEVLKK